MSETPEMIQFPPKGFSYGNRKATGQFEFHPVLPMDKRPRELVVKRLMELRRLTLPTLIRHTTCRWRTEMGVDLVETMLVAPHYGLFPYKRLFCSKCGTYEPIESFTWADHGNLIAGDPDNKMAQEKPVWVAPK